MQSPPYPDILVHIANQGFLEPEDYKAVSRDFHFLARENAKEVIIDENGTELHYLDGKLHRDGDQPAVIYKNGRKKWYRHGVEYFPE